MKQKVKGIVFDIGSIVTRPPKILASDVLSKYYKIDLDEFLDAMFKNWDEKQTGKISMKQYYESVARDLKIEDVKRIGKKWKSLMEKHTEPNHTVISIIKNLKKNYKIIVFTNVSENAEKIRIKKGIYNYFDIKLISCTEGMKKPNKDFYRLLIERSNLKPNELIFIDDSETNVLVAKKLGLYTIHFQNSRQLKEDLKKLGVKW